MLANTALRLQPINAPALGSNEVGRTGEPLALTRSEQQRLELALLGRFGAPVQRAALEVQRQLGSMPRQITTDLLRALATEPQRNAEVVRQALRSPFWLSANLAQRAQVARLFGRCPEKASALGALLGDRTKLAAKDSEGQTLLENLDRLARQPLNAWLQGQGIGRQQVLQDAISEVSQPAVETRADGSGDAEAQNLVDLPRQDPAEYVRVLCGLCDREGRVRLRDGEEVKLSRLLLLDGGELPSSVTERIVVAAMLDLARRRRSGRSRRNKGRARRELPGAGREALGGASEDIELRGEREVPAAMLRFFARLGSAPLAARSPV